MSRTSKVLLVIFVPILVILGVLYALVNAVYVPKPEPVTFPQGELTDSIFTEQNNNYVKNENLKYKHTFESVPYTIDRGEGDDAVVGTGTIYKIDNSDDFFLYMTEYDDSTNAPDIISSQFPAVLLINYIPEMTKVTIQADKKGFINGFSAEFIGETISVSDGTNIREAAVIGYALDVPGVDYAGKHIFVGVGTTEINTETLARCADYLGSVMQTLTKDTKLEETRKKDAEKKAIEEEEAALKAAEAGAESATTAQTIADERAQAPQIASIPIPVDRQYINLKINVEWDNYNPDAVLELFNPEKTMYFDPSFQSETGAGFVIPEGEVGTYELHIANAGNCGSIRTMQSGSEMGQGGASVEEQGNVSEPAGDETPAETDGTEETAR